MSSKPTSEKKLLEIKDVVVHYGKTRALKGVSLDIPKRMIVALIGANGAGKSTILRLISGLMRPTSGGVRFEENSIDGMPAHEIARLGISHVPEGRRLFTKMSVLDNLRIGSRDSQRITTIMETVFAHFPILKERIEQRAGTLSGGEQQMLAIGRGLMAEPRLLLLDEPSLGLSPMMTMEIGRIVVEINRQETTILLAEQNARLALKLSEKGYVLETGLVAIEGDTEDLIHNKAVIKAYLSA
jgi:branched-chain amino acid transport system ATP-binding protein